MNTTPQVYIQVGEADFDLASEYQAAQAIPGSGAIVAFAGLVRDWHGGRALRLEHYPGMTQKALAHIVDQAATRWPLNAVRVIHRVGTLQPGEQIVLVITASAHRVAAYEANAFIMDYLKTEAPFWKQEIGDAGASWVEARASDDAARQRWEQNSDD